MLKAERSKTRVTEKLDLDKSSHAGLKDVINLSERLCMDIALTLHRKNEFLSNSIHLSQEAFLFICQTRAPFLCVLLIQPVLIQWYNTMVLMIKLEQIIEVCIRFVNPL